MKLRWANLSSLMIMGTLLLTMTAGCGLHKVAPIEDPADAPTPAPAASTTPASGSVTPTPAPSTAPDVPVVTGDLTARVTNIETKGLMFTRHVIATVEVANPTTTTLTGTLTCTFGKGTSSDQIQTKQVSLMAHQTQTFTFDEKAWFDKEAKADIKTDHPVTAQGYGNRF